MVSLHTENREPAPSALPDWDDFRLLLSVAQLGSISRAAAALGLTQPTVSRRIDRFESAVGVRVVDRLPSGAVLTCEGQRIVEELNIAHGAIQRALSAARDQQTRVDDVKLLMTDGMATYWLPRFLPFLFEKHANLEFRVYTASDSGAEQRGHFDLSIHYVQPTDPNLIVARLGTLHFIAYASHGYLARYGMPTTLAELSRHRLLDYILYLIDKGSWMTRLPALIGEGRARLFTNSSASLVESVRNGAGIALLPSYLSVFERDLVPLDVDLRFETPFWLCYAPEAVAKPGVRLAIDFLKHIYNRRAMPWFGEAYLAPSTFVAPDPEQVMARLGVLPLAPAAE
jgi:molybdate transport repressor ModE-like protein